MNKSEQKKAKDKFIRSMCRRTQQVRIDSGYTQPEMAEALGILNVTYSKYESRSPLKQYLIPKFCELTGFSSWYLLTGKLDSKGK